MSERTPLLSPSPRVLYPLASSLVSALRASQPTGLVLVAPPPPPDLSTADPAVLLLAHHLAASTCIAPFPIREAVAAARRAEEVKSRLEDAVGRWLDKEDDDSEDEDGVRAVEAVLWTPWELGGPFGRRRVNAIELMLPPFARGCAHLVHPVVQHVLSHTWTHGLPLSSGAFSLSPLTPARQHAFDLVVLLVMLGTTLATCLGPSAVLYPTETTGPAGAPARLRPHEVAWAVYALGSLWDSLRPIPTASRALLVPTHLALLSLALPLLGRPYPFSLLALSIPCLTLLPLLPLPPSIPLLALPRPALLALSAALLGLLSGLRAGALFVPPALAVTALFAYSMDGDVYRGFIVDASVLRRFLVSNNVFRQPLAGPDTREAWIATSAAAATHLAVPDPAEPSVAPFETRAALLSTLAILAVLALALPLIHALALPSPRSSRRRTPHPGAETWPAHDDAERVGWDAQYGPAGAQTCAASARAVIAYADARLVIPLNLLLVPLDVGLAAATAVGVWSDTTATQEWIAGLRDKVARRIMGALCALVGGRGRRVRLANGHAEGCP
ncbi:hypothetical protein Q5752_002201 [Cryptotrichosporon argae]